MAPGRSEALGRGVYAASRSEPRDASKYLPTAAKCCDVKRRERRAPTPLALHRSALFLLALLFVSTTSFGQTKTSAAHHTDASHPSGADFIRVSKDRKGFVFSLTGKPFSPWGFNYDHDRNGRLLETYWIDEWQSVVGDFQEMKNLGANTVRVHLQVGRFMLSPSDMNPESMQQLARLLDVAQELGLYLDITGLGCYDKKEVPPWYNRLDEEARWAAQAFFWQEIAKLSKNSPAVFCYDLMNEPILSEDKSGARDWTPGAFGNRYYVQRLALNFYGRTGPEIAKEWVNRMVSAIRKEGSSHLITIGTIPWALTFPGAKPDFYAPEVGKNLDFVSVHFYPSAGHVKEAVKALKVYQVGKPLVVEEIYPLNCPISELAEFIKEARPITGGWISFYWGKTIEEYKNEKRGLAENTTLQWLEYWRDVKR